jgi:bifunctional oligoribonuclease and PAP phosphatase NrnA
MSLSAISFHSHSNYKFNSPKVVSFKGQELITPERQEKMKAIAKEISKAKKIAIITHINPDGDAAGSAASLKNLIQTKYPKKSVDVFILDNIPSRYKFLEDTKSFEYINENTNINEIIERNYDLAISVDSATKALLGSGAEIFDSAEKRIKIDHHADEENFGDINLTCEDASSASQIILMLANSMKVKLDKNLASDIYLGLITDTAGFRYMKKPADVFEDSSTLAKTSFDTQKVYCSTMDSMTQATFKLYAKAINRVNFIEGGRIAYFVDDNSLYEKDIEPTEAKNIFDRIVGNIMPNIEGVKIAAKLTNKENERNSLRGNGIQVDKLAEEFGGGGHPYSSGFRTGNQAISQILQKMAAYVNKKPNA